MKERERIMSKLDERESRRRSSVIGSIVDSAPAAASGKKGRPKEDRETKKRVSLSVLPSLYEDIQKIAYVQRRSVSDIMSELMEGYRSENVASISEFDVITKH